MDDSQRPRPELQKIDSQIGPRGQSALEGVGSDIKLDQASDGQVKQVSPRRTTRRKPDFEEFLDNVRDAITSDASRDSVTLLLATIKSGYKGKFTSDHLTQVFSLVKDWSRCSQFALRLSVHIKQKPKSSKIACFLKNRLVSHSRDVAAYPGAVKIGTDSEQRRTQLLTWIDRSMKETIPQTTEVTLNAHNWVCWAMVCLMEEPWTIQTETIFAIIERFAIQGENRKTEDEEKLEFVIEIGSIFGTRQVNIQKFVRGMKLIAAARSLERNCREELQATNLIINAKETRLDELTREIQELKTVISNANDQITTLNQSVVQKSREIEQEKEERHLDKEHWEYLSEQRSVKQAIEISSRLAHEISEARHCLNGDTPNIRMAMDRLNWMDKWLEKLKGN